MLEELRGDREARRRIADESRTHDTASCCDAKRSLLVPNTIAQTKDQSFSAVTKELRVVELPLLTMKEFP